MPPGVEERKERGRGGREEEEGEREEGEREKEEGRGVDQC